ncbi:FkbM family methyltransferase [Roseomonas marmotae]|nr:FkbM family methyltransferase [Roseomonas marmotae]
MPRIVEEFSERLTLIEAAMQKLEPLASPQVKPAPSPQVDPLSVYTGFTEADLEVFAPFADIRREPRPGCITNFLGVQMPTRYVRGSEGLAGRVLGLPVPTDGWHSEAVEWIGALKAVLAAQGRFVSLELGAGWGPWSVAAGVAARHLGIAEIRLRAVEADPGHHAFLVEHLHDHGFTSPSAEAYLAAVGAEDGTARWPRVPDPAGDWGSAPQAENAETDHIGRQVQDWMDVRVLGINSLLAAEPIYDLVHIDIQGGELDVCRAGIASLNERARFVIIGTHDSRLHGELIQLFFQNEWVLENEKPPRFRWRQGAKSLVAMVEHDGTLVLRNSRR